MVVAVDSVGWGVVVVLSRCVVVLRVLPRCLLVDKPVVAARAARHWYLRGRRKVERSNEGFMIIWCISIGLFWWYDIKRTLLAEV